MPCTIRSLLCATLVAAILVAAEPARALQSFPAPAGWPEFAASLAAQEQIGPGVQYERWVLSQSLANANGAPSPANGPLSISIVTVDLTNPFVALTAESQNGMVQGPGARLSAIADSAHALAGVNGDYFDIGGSNAPINALDVNGRFLHQPSGAAVFYVGADKQPHFGPLTWRAVVTPSNGAALSISGLNDWSASTPISLLTPDLGNPAAHGATEAVLGPAGGGGGDFVVDSVARNLTTLLTLASGQIGIAAHGDNANSIATEFTPGETVHVEYDGEPPPASIVTAVGGGPLLVHDGKPYDDPAAPAPQEKNVRYPLTGAGASGDGHTLWLVVVDGRRPAVSVGITRPMFAAFFIALGAAEAMAFDSGGSSEMVVRHLGDPGVGVVTTPSDGRERAIADGLFVLNTAPAGPPAQIELRTGAPSVLLGSRIAVIAEAVDGNLQPVALPPSSLSWRVDPSVALSSGAAGEFVALRPGDATITVTSGTITASSTVRVVSSLANLTISGFGADVPLGTTVKLKTAAVDAQGRPVAVDANAVTWSASSGAAMTPAGEITAGTAPAAVTVVAEAGGIRATALVQVGDHASPLEQVLPVGTAPGAWRFSASSSAATGALDATQAPDGSSAARLSYRFYGASGTRAAYAVNEIAAPGSPIAVACDVFGDGNGEWLRASYRNADVIVDSITLARHVDWVGWRTVRAAVLPQVRWPIVLTQLYVVQPEKRASQGGLWLRNLAAVYPGP